MAEKTGEKLKTYGKLPVHIVEDHNEALPVIYSAIGSRYLPLNNNCLVHFDSHPDLLLPKEMDHESVWNKYELFSNLSIENWILPGCYSGQFNTIYWVKPNWCSQIPSGTHKIHIGSHRNKIRVDTNLYYFLSDGLYTNKADMVNVREFNLNVIEMAKDECVTGLNEYLEKKKSFILDIDLDFFSTNNPFIGMFGKGNLYNKLKSLYSFDVPHNLVLDSDDEITKDKLQRDLMQKVSDLRNRQLDELKYIFTKLEDDAPFDDITRDLTVIEKSKILDIQQCVRDFYNDQIDWDLLQNAGMTCDSTDLPHHISSDDEMKVLFKEFRTFLRSVHKKPVLVTIARSSLDEYCPPEQVSFIQENVLDILDSVYGDMVVEKVYERSD